MNILLCSSVAIAIAASVSLSASAVESDGNAPSVGSTPVQGELQPWQRRRAEFLKAVQGVREGDPDAKKAFDAVLTEFETRTFSRTPIENLEIIGVFYMPKEGVDPGLSLVVVNLVLGWYDALRFGSESGRAEILNNEHFFKKAFLLGSSDIASKALKFLESNPERASQLVAQGIAFAEKYRETSAYDRQWPTAYGLERLTCAMGRGSCAAPPPLAKEQWDKAWEDAKHRVIAYFQVAKPK